MAVFGTKKFWRPAPGASTAQKDNQILKNAGYLNIQVHSVNYMAKGNFWQRHFGGRDTIALTTGLKYQNGTTLIEATTVQDKREVKTDRIYNLGIQRYIASKIPTHADAIALNVKMTAVKGDELQAKFDMLNNSEFKPALDLVPMAVGQVMMVTSLVKKLFTDTSPNNQLEADYAGLISSQAENEPAVNGRLTQGQLIMISTDDNNWFEGADGTKFEVKGDTLYYNNEIVENTYIIFNISFDAFKGEDQKSSWSKKYQAAVSLLDKIEITVDPEEIKKIINDSKTLWLEGNTLLDADETYVNKEKTIIKASYLKAINDRQKEIPKFESLKFFTKPLLKEGLTEIIKNVSAQSLKHSLPNMEKFVAGNAEALTEPMTDKQDKEVAELLEQDVEEYRKENSLLKLTDLFARMGAVGDTVRNPGKTFEELYFNRLNDPATKLKAQKFHNTYNDKDIKKFRERIDRCLEKGRNEGGEARVECYCTVLKDIKVGNGGDIPDPDWQADYDQLKCERIN